MRNEVALDDKIQQFHAFPINTLLVDYMIRFNSAASELEDILLSLSCFEKAGVFQSFSSNKQEE